MRRGGLPRITRAVTTRKTLESAATALVLLLATGVLITAADASCPDGDSSCACEAGHIFIVPSLSCSGACPCTPWVGLNGSTISSNSERYSTYENNAVCVWTISGVNPQVTFGSFATEAGFDYVYVDECVDAECTRVGRVLLS